MPPQSDALVFFGATGDLAAKQIFPALLAMVRRGHLSVPVIGVAGSKLSVEAFRSRIHDNLAKHGAVDEAAFEQLGSRLAYVGGDYDDPATYLALRQTLSHAQHPLHYLAIPPSLFARVAEGLSVSGCAKAARVVVEKPFGHDLKSARGLNDILQSCFSEDCIFRIDHYLGKEPVQNLTYFRFANPLVNSGWNRQSIESMQITMAETFDVAGRGKFYEETGAIRDVVQNHMLEVIAGLAMEPPGSTTSEASRDERGKLLKAVRTLASSEVVRGQYRGYRQEAGVAADSQVETFAALRFHIDNDRWSGVPFYVRAGKCLPIMSTEVLVKFRPAPDHPLSQQDRSESNYYRFQLSPDVIVALGANVKKPGEGLVGEPIELVLHHKTPDEMAPYERLLGDAAQGDPTLFAREDAVEEAWRIVDPVLSNPSPVVDYDRGTWGPSETICPNGGWHNPS